MVEVWRSLDRPRPLTRLDVDLPAGAELVDWEIGDGREQARLGQQEEARARADLAAPSEAQGSRPRAQEGEEGRYRVHVTRLTPGVRPLLHYRFAAPVGCHQGKLVLRMPGSLEESPIPAEVTVTLEAQSGLSQLAQVSLAGQPAELREGTRHLVMHALAPSHDEWEISWSYRASATELAGLATAAVGQWGEDRPAGGRSRLAAMVAICRGGGAPSSEIHPAAPSSVTLLVDRSRSVGQGGLSEERVAARALLEALPPATPFNAVFFGATATPLFPVPRLPTREALDAFSEALDPNQLERSTDVVAALALARRLYTPSATEPAWIVIVTDGALPLGQTGERMLQALAGVPPTHLRVLVLLVRQRGDEKVDPSARTQYLRLVERFGGLVRELPAEAGHAADTLLAAMAEGGDWFELGVANRMVAEVLAPGQGANRVFAMDRPAVARALVAGSYRSRGRGNMGWPAHLRLSARGLLSVAPPRMATMAKEVPTVSVEGKWLGPLVEAGERRAWAGATGKVRVTVLPIQPPHEHHDDGERGGMSEGVLRSALWLGFLPRARACYLGRKVASAADAALQGRVRLELTIERGELSAAVVRKSTLNHAEIEACLCQAAWAVDYPRPEHRDALTVANLNLVFRPRTAPDDHPDGSAQHQQMDQQMDHQIDQEIELMVGPLPAHPDFEDLLSPPDHMP